ncbi:MAG: NAD-dependent epimerase/dehydratase family protein [Alphaproteobacteria bacterium]|nr:NAD-dependent epimerase/dehydratase family protein [Alphaproteobacteria bacterium]
MKVFVTGGSGFVGGHAIEALAAAGHEVLAMARSERSAEVVRGLGAAPVRCDLDTVAAEHLSGCDAVVHAAAYVEETGSWDDYWRANVEGTQRVVDAARAAGVRRFVLVSTNATVFDSSDQLDVDEAWPYPASPPFAYAATKAEAERRVLAADGEGMTTVALRPCFVWGPRDNTVLPALRRMAGDGSFVWIDGGRARVSTTHVANLVHAIELSLTQGRGGQAYFVADEDQVTLRQFVGGLATATGLTLPDRSVPAALARPAARALDLVFRTFRLGASPVPVMTVDVMSSAMTVRTEKARAELGWTPVVDRERGLATLTLA